MGWDAVDLDKVNICSHPMSDLADDLVWEQVHKDILAGVYTFVFCGTPCETFSALRNHRPGPPVLRTRRFPYGRPDLSPEHKEQVRLGNLFVRRTEAACLAIESVGGGWCIENPEPRQDAVSLFDLDEMVALAARPGVDTTNFDQCRYGAETRKPTRLMFKGGAFAVMYQRCNHAPQRWTAPDGSEYWAPHERMVGRRRRSGDWASKASAAYTGALNKRLAACIASGHRRASGAATGEEVHSGAPEAQARADPGRV